MILASCLDIRLRIPEIPGTQERIWDRELPGFGVRVYASDKEALPLQIRRDGVISPEEARKRAAVIIPRIKTG